MSRAILLAGFTGLAIVLGAAIAYELTHDADADTDAAATATGRGSPDRAAAPALVAKEEDLPDFVDDILARPLFSLSRKPVSRPNSATTVAGPADNTLPRLAGIIMTSDVKFAIFQPRDPAKPVSVEEGGEIAGRKVESIDFEEVVLSGPDGEERLHPTPDPAIEAAAAAMGLDNPDAQPPRRPARPGVRPGVNRPGMPRPPGVVTPNRPTPANAVHGRTPVKPGLPLRPNLQTPNNRAPE